MITITFLIAAVSIDALSYGLAQGLQKNKLTFLNALIMTILSTIIFSVPLFLSQFIFKYFNEDVCNLINGIVLILLGVYYLVKYMFLQKNKNNNQNVKNKTICLKNCILSTFPISLDAFFTALLNGYTIDNFLFTILIFILFTFCCLYITNKISLKISNISYFDMSWLSGVIFIIIGILKSFGI